MRRRQLISLTKFDQVGNLIFVALMRLIEGILLNLQLSLEEIDRVFVLWVQYTVNRNPVLFILERAHNDVLVQLVDKIVYFGLQ